MKASPHLRFSASNKKYKTYLFGDIATNISGKYTPNKEDVNLMCIELEHIERETGRLLGFTSAGEQRSTKNRFDKEAVLFGKLRPYLKKYWFASSEGVCSSEIWVLNSKDKNKITNHYLYYLIQTSKFLYTANKSSGSKMPRADWSNVSNSEVTIPDIEEQNKVANFLSLIDRKLGKQEEKIAQLELAKKFIIQKIFSREIKFKDHNEEEFPEWESVSMGCLGETYGGLSGKTKEDFGHGNSMYVTYMNVFSNVLAKPNMVELVEVGPKERQNKVIEGDILFTTSSETPDEVGMASVWLGNQANLYLNSFCFGYRLLKDEINSLFLTYQLRSPEMRRKITLLAQGSTRYNLSKTELMKVHVFIPSQKEQEQIVDFLSTYDLKIEREREKLALIRNQKKGFIQRMIL